MSENRQYYINTNGQLIPVTKEVYLAYYRSKHRERYYERDLKIENVVRDNNCNIIGYKPSKEDSLERLMENGEDYADENENVEETVFNFIITEELHNALKMLNEDEQKLIYALFFEGMTERQAAVIFGITQKAINKRKTKILLKLKNILKT